jgi:carboxyl-terminal processing protease
MNRLPISKNMSGNPLRLLAQLALLFIIAVLPAASGRAEISSRQVDDTYTKLEQFAAVLSLLQDYYVDEIDTARIIDGAIDGLLFSLDPHSAYLTQERYRNLQEETSGMIIGIGVEVTMEEGRIMVISPIAGTPAAAAGIKARDVILAIDGQPVEEVPPFEAIKRLRGQEGSQVSISVYREGEENLLEFTLTREPISIDSVIFTELGGNIWWVRIAAFQQDTAAELARHLAEAEKSEEIRGLILDLRNNPGGLLNQAVQVVNFFIEDAPIVSTRGRDPRQNSIYQASATAPYGQVPMVVLINEGSASGAEIVAGALQDHRRALVVGTVSFGKGSVQTVIPMANGTALRVTTARYYTPSGRSIQETGISPDLPIGPGTSVSEDGHGTERVREMDLAHHLANPDTPAEPTTVLAEDAARLLAGDSQLQAAYTVITSIAWYAAATESKK